MCYLHPTFVERAEQQGFALWIQVHVLTLEAVDHGRQAKLIRRDCPVGLRTRVPAGGDEVTADSMSGPTNLQFVVYSQNRNPDVPGTRLLQRRLHLLTKQQQKVCHWCFCCV